jgi:hypothetical protein
MSPWPMACELKRTRPARDVIRAGLVVLGRYVRAALRRGAPPQSGLDAA